MMPEEEVVSLRAENAALREQLAAALARIAELEQQPRDPPPFVKPNRPQPATPKRPCKKRAPHHNLRRTLQPSVESLKQQARASPILHGDETSWRENGLNGYIWAFSTPGEQAVRYYEYDGSRSQQVVHRFLGGQFAVTW